MGKNEIYTEASKILMQIDIEGHSEWFQVSNKREAIYAKANFADKVEKIMKNNNFELVFWAGDGGLYASDSVNLSNYDLSINAGRKVASYFQTWRGENENRAKLKLRISIHCGYPIYIHKKPGYWASDDINVFVKHERDIAIAGTIAITDKIRNSLKESTLKDFPDSTEREVLLGSISGDRPLIRYIYYSIVEDENEILKVSQKSFGNWLKALSHDIGFKNESEVGPKSSVCFFFGDISILFFSPHIASTLIVDFKLQKIYNYDDLKDNELSVLQDNASKIKSDSEEKELEDQKKISVHRIVFPLEDYPCMRIEWHPEYWSLTRAFHKQVESDKLLWRRLAKNVADVQTRGLLIPNILCSHIIVRISESNETKYVLMCQRNIRGWGDTYHQGRWSCSIEEQFKPGENAISCVKRGISEELIGPSASEHVEIKIVSVFLENSILNTTLLAIVDVPLSFNEIVELWKTEAIDKNEHRQIIGFPLKRDLIISIGQKGEMTENAKDECLIADDEIFKTTDEWKLHPTSIFRLASVLWHGK